MDFAAVYKETPRWHSKLPVTGSFKYCRGCCQVTIQWLTSPSLTRNSILEATCNSSLFMIAVQSKKTFQPWDIRGWQLVVFFNCTSFVDITLFPSKALIVVGGHHTAACSMQQRSHRLLHSIASHQFSFVSTRIWKWNSNIILCMKTSQKPDQSFGLFYHLISVWADRPNTRTHKHPRPKTVSHFKTHTTRSVSEYLMLQCAGAIRVHAQPDWMRCLVAHALYLVLCRVI